MSKKTSLSVTIITLNEEENIKRCLASVKQMANEIIVVDSGSTDNTVEIVKECGAKIFVRDFDNYADQKNFAISKATRNWIFSLDADEVVTPELAKEILKAIKDSRYDGYLISRRNIILGAEIKHSRWSPDKHVWLWKRKKGKWKGKVHEEVLVDGGVGELKNAKIHYQHKTVAEFIDMLNKYTELEAEEKISKEIKFSFFRMFYDPTLSFFRRFVYKKGFLDGWRGFILAYLMAIYRMATWIKVWEREKVVQV